VLLTAGQALAITLPFTEDFATDSAQWLNVLDWVPSGGPDDGSHARMSANFLLSEPDDAFPAFKGEDQTLSLGFAASGGAFVGDWIAAGVRQLTAHVRHDLEQPVAYFVRLAPAPANFPGAVGFTSPVPPGVWSEIRFPVNPASLLFLEGAGSFETVINRIGNVQIGLFVPESLAGVDQSFNLEIDKISEAASGLILVQGLLTLACVGAGGVRGNLVRTAHRDADGKWIRPTTPSLRRPDLRQVDGQEKGR
jgi:hypothetical protein